MLAHGRLSLYSLAAKDPVFEVVAVEEYEVFEVDKVVEFLEGERVEVGVYSFE